MQGVAGGTYALIFSGLAVALLVAMLAPAPARPHDSEPDVPTGLLTVACLATLLMGSLALSDHHLAAVICGAVAWLVVVPCLWLARAPDGWDDEDEDDDGGSPRPASPFTPPAPDDRPPGLDPAGRAGAQGAWVATPAAAFTPATAEAPLPAWAMRQDNPAWAVAAEPQFVAATGDLYADLPLSDPTWEPAPASGPDCPEADVPPGRRIRRAVLRVRGEHRSVAHLRAGAHPRHRPRRAGLPHRVLRACRRWLGVESAECRRRARQHALEHGGRRHARRTGARRDAISR